MSDRSDAWERMLLAWDRLQKAQKEGSNVGEALNAWWQARVEFEKTEAEDDDNQ